MVQVPAFAKETKGIEEWNEPFTLYSETSFGMTKDEVKNVKKKECLMLEKNTSWSIDMAGAMIEKLSCILGKQLLIRMTR